MRYELRILNLEGEAITTLSKTGRVVAAVLGMFDLSTIRNGVYDLELRVLDGSDVATREMRRVAPALPVIGVTAHALVEEREKSLAAGMVEHVTKPIDIDTLVIAILRQVAGRWSPRT